MGTLQVGGTTLGVKNTSTNKIDLSNTGTLDNLPFFACRAWVNFDGTKDTSGASSTSNTNRLIRASGNVASVLRNGTGDYTVNFTTAMPDANYSVCGSSSNDPSSHYSYIGTKQRAAFQTSSIRIVVRNDGGTGTLDAADLSVAIFR